MTSPGVLLLLKMFCFLFKTTLIRKWAVTKQNICQVRMIMDAFGFYLIHSMTFINCLLSMDFQWTISKVGRWYLGLSRRPRMSLIHDKMTSFVFEQVMPEALRHLKLPDSRWPWDFSVKHFRVPQDLMETMVLRDLLDPRWVFLPLLFFSTLK